MIKMGKKFLFSAPWKTTNLKSNKKISCNHVHFEIDRKSLFPLGDLVRFVHFVKVSPFFFIDSLPHASHEVARLLAPGKQSFRPRSAIAMDSISPRGLGFRGDPLRQVNNATISQADYQKRLEGINILSKAVGKSFFFVRFFWEKVSLIRRLAGACRGAKELGSIQNPFIIGAIWSLFSPGFDQHILVESAEICVLPCVLFLILLDRCGIFWSSKETWKPLHNVKGRSFTAALNPQGSRDGLAGLLQDLTAFFEQISGSEAFRQAGRCCWLKLLDIPLKAGDWKMHSDKNMMWFWL